MPSSLGAVYITVVVAAALLGVSGLQGWYYFSHQKDGWIIQTLVAANLSFDFASQVLVTYTGFVYLVTLFQKNINLEKESLGAQTLDRVSNFSSLANVIFKIELPFNGLTILAAPNTFIYMSFFFAMGRFYSNSLLASLNARKMVRQTAQAEHTSFAADSDNISPSHCENRNSALIFRHSKTTTIDNIRTLFTSREEASDLDSEMGVNLEPAEDLSEIVLA
ncbi:hypothetical protein GYMLUDRAFT_251692 [Collybiopsis luxurians FD-317 M1]|uniref:DUF6534 domain-containing protein n=1 Tax=Collybiopsis luxurians FD-317 M1 TaxID=944289 RepID=A0A0D0C1Z0_9AGAR|nr:hypothetical protein GYMLUDRAFT_251692 [Collybiopsis luxurians FD-317 M1]